MYYLLFPFLLFFLFGCSNPSQQTTQANQTLLKAYFAPSQNKIAVNSSLIISFSHNIDTNSISETSLFIEENNNTKLTLQTTVVNNTIKITPQSLFLKENNYTLHLTTNIKSVEGYRLEKEILWDFQTYTQDNLAPKIVAFLPEESADQETNIIVEFSESLDPTNIQPNTMLLFDEQNNTISTTLHFEQRWLWLTPNQPLEKEINYKVLLQNTLYDLSQNKIDLNTSFSFKTQQSIIEENNDTKLLAQIDLNTTTSSLFVENNTTLYIGAQNTIFKIKTNYQDLNISLQIEQSIQNDLFGIIYSIKKVPDICQNFNFKFVIGSSNGILFLDENFSIIKTFPLSQPAFDLTLSCQENKLLVYVANGINGINILEINTDNNITNKNFINNQSAFSLQIDQNILYFNSYDNGLIIYDLNGSYLQTLPSSSLIRSFEKDQNKLLVSRGILGVSIFTQNTSDLYVEENRFTLDTTTLQTFTSETKIFALTSTKGLTVVDKQTLQKIQKIQSDKHFISIGGSDPLFYILSQNGILQSYNLYPPQTIEQNKIKKAISPFEITKIMAPQKEKSFSYKNIISQEYLLVGAEQTTYLYKQNEDLTYKLLTQIQSPQNEKNQAIAFENNFIAIQTLNSENNTTTLYLYKKISDTDIQLVSQQSSQSLNPQESFDSVLALRDNIIAINTLNNETNQSSCYIFKIDLNNTLTQVQHLEVENAKSFAQSIALYPPYILIGDPEDSSIQYKAGSAYLYQFENNNSETINQIAHFTNSIVEENEKFGSSLAINSNLLAIGTQKQIVHLFKYSQNIPYFQIEQIESARANNQQTEINFGKSLAFDDGYLAIGSPSTSLQTNGSVYIFENNETNLTQVALLQAHIPQENDNFGNTISFNNGLLSINGIFDAKGVNYIFNLYAQTKVYLYNPPLETILVDENHLNIYNFDAASPTSSMLHYSVDALSEDLFSIEYGMLTFKQPKDYELDAHQYDVEIKIADEVNNTIKSTLHIELQNIIEPFVIEKFTSMQAEKKEVAISNNFIVIAKPHHNNELGEVKVYKKQKDSSLKELTTLQATTQEMFVNFGSCIAIDGDYFIVSSPNEDTNAIDDGAIYLYRIETNETISLVEKIVSEKLEDAQQLGLNSCQINQNYIGVSSNSNLGSVDIFTFTQEGNISQIAELLPDETQEFTSFGNSIDIEQETFAIGDAKANSVYIFEKDINNSFEQIAKLQVNQDEAFGSSLALQKPYLLIGAKNTNTQTTQQSGALYIFKQTQTFDEILKFQPATLQTNDYFGSSVAIANNLIAIGSANPENGSISIYQFNEDETLNPLNIYGGYTSSPYLGRNMAFDNTTLITSSDLFTYIIDMQPSQRTYLYNFKPLFEYEEQLTNSFFLPLETASPSQEEILLSLNGEDKYLFEIISNTLRFKSLVDFENPQDKNHDNTYKITAELQTQKLPLQDFNSSIKVINRDYFEVAKLDTNEQQEDGKVGSSVAMDNNLIVIGTTNNINDTFNSGSVYIFEQIDENQTRQIAKIQADDAQEDDYFGASVAIKNNLIVVGAPQEDSQAEDAGSVYIFKHQTDNSVQQIQKIQAQDSNESNFFGNSVAIDGNYIVVGAPYANSEEERSGAVYLFKYITDDQILQLAKIVPEDIQTDDNFGISVAISGDYIAVGANGKENRRGSAYLFKRINDEEIIELSTLKTEEELEEEDQFGSTIAIDQDLIAVGSPSLYKEQNNEGKVYLFKNIDDNIVLLPTIQADNKSQNDNFGASISLHNNLLIVGAPNKNNEEYNSGSAYLFEINNEMPQQLFELNIFALNENAEFGKSVAINNNYFIVGVPGFSTERLYNSGTSYLFLKDTNQAE